ncbi:MAG: hypothetical protein MUF04_14950 [Akkermansiaceae bacterium]|nr:hypothetical protein [Akkermansiaceae bacterium]
MKWTCLLLFGVCLTFTALGQTTYTWTGATMRDEDPHNNSNSWDAPGNWAPQGVPGAGDTVVIGNGDTVAECGRVEFWSWGGDHHRGCGFVMEWRLAHGSLAQLRDAVAGGR